MRLRHEAEHEVVSQRRLECFAPLHATSHHGLSAGRRMRLLGVPECGRSHDHHDERGHWEGATLVIETSNFVADRWWTTANPTGRLATSGKLELVERFTRIDSETLEYEVTVNDPDGQRFVTFSAVEQDEGEEAPPKIRVVMNWYEEFRDRDQ